MYKLYVFYFLVYAGFAIPSMFLPLYLLNKGFSTPEIGLLSAIGAFVAVLSNLIWGYISDRYKTIKRVLLINLTAGAIVSSFVFGAQTMALLIPITAVFYFFYAPAPALIDSLANSRVRKFGSIRMWGSIGLMAASLGVGLLTDYIGIRHLSWIYAGVMIAVITFGFTIQDSDKTKTPVTLASLRIIMRNRSVLGLLGIVFLIAVPNRMNETLIGVYLGGMGGGEAQVGLAWMAATVSAIPAYAAADYILGKRTPSVIIAICAALFAVRWLLVGFAESPNIVIALQAMNGVTFPLFFIASVKLMSSLVPEELRTIGQTSLVATMSGLAGITGSLAGGWGMEHLEPQWTYFIGSAMAAAGSAIIVGRGIRNKRRDLRVEASGTTYT